MNSILQYIVTISALFLTIFFFIFIFKKQKRHLENFKKDVVYLYQFPSSKNVSCVSPFAVKLEAWLKLKKIPYISVRSVSKWSSKKQIPFIEYNGKQTADSNFIIDYLSKKFNCQDDISDYDKGISRAVEMMLDNQTAMSYFYYRYVEKDSVFIESWKFLSSFKRKILKYIMRRNFRKRSYYHGIGRHSPSEIYELGMMDLLAISNILGDRKYLLGDKMTTVDCYIFGHLSQILYIPSVNYPHIQWIKTKCPNLISFCERIIIDLWPEWNTFENDT